MGRGEKEGTTPIAVTDAFRINKFVNLISESDMIDGSSFFIANVNKHTNHYSNGVGIFMCMSSSINFLVLFRDSLLPRPENGPGTQAGKERVLYYLQAHARNDGIFPPKTGGKTIFGKRFLIWA